MEKGLVRIGLPIAVVLLLTGAAVWFASRSSSNLQPSPQSPTLTEDTPLSELPSKLNRPPVNVAVAVVPWAAKSPATPTPIKKPFQDLAEAPHVHAGLGAPVEADVAVLPWDQSPKATQQPPTAAPSKGQEAVAVAALPWELDAKGAIRLVQSANPAAQVVASNSTPGDIPTASLPWETSKPAKRLTHPALPPGPVEYAQAILNCPPELIEWLKAWEADQATNKPTSDSRVWALSQILTSTQLTFAQLFDLGQRIQNAEGDRVGAIFYHAAEPLAAAELAPFAIGDPKAKDVLDMMWNMQWCLGNTADWSSALANATLLLQREPAGSRASFLAEYQLGESTYNLGRDHPESRDKALAIYQHMLDRDGPNRLDDKGRDSVEWAIGLIHYESAQYALAMPHLEQVMGNQHICHPKYMPEILIATLARVGHVEEAESQFESYVRKYRPEAKDVVWLIQTIDIAKNNSQ